MCRIRLAHNLLAFLQLGPTFFILFAGNTKLKKRTLVQSFPNEERQPEVEFIPLILTGKQVHIKTMNRQNSSPPGHCRFAIPKKGRLFEKAVELLKGAGIEFRREARLDVALCVGLPITIVFLPAADIAKYVGDGNVDLGITGLDVVKESMVEVEHIMDLGFGKCKLCVQAPVAKHISDVADLAGQRIVTSFPDLTKQFFQKYDEEKGVQTKVNFVSGSVEAACGLGLADAIVDLVETGTTMKVRF